MRAAPCRSRPPNRSERCSVSAPWGGLPRPPRRARKPAPLGKSAMSPRHFFTIGHSTHTLERFLELLAEHRIELLADIRRFPGSRRHPHFSKEQLAAFLPKAGIEYCWFEELGGRRGKTDRAS